MTHPARDPRSRHAGLDREDRQGITCRYPGRILPGDAALPIAPRNDEMLRLPRALQYLHLLMVRVPEGVFTEREKLERLFGEAKQALKDARESDEAYHRKLEQRLTRLPEAVANGIKPEMIAAKINESLHQQFVASTIPQTARSLCALADQIKDASTEFSAAANAIGESYNIS